MLGVDARGSVAIEDSPLGVHVGRGGGLHRARRAQRGRASRRACPTTVVRPRWPASPWPTSPLCCRADAVDVPAGSLCDVLPAVAATLGVPDAPDRLGLRELGRRRRPGRVVLLVDGMGLHLLPRLAPHAPLLASALAGGDGTAAGAGVHVPVDDADEPGVARHRACGPGEHGILGFTVAVPGTDRRLTHITWRDDPPPARVAAGADVVPASGRPRRRPPAVVLPRPFRGSGLTDAAYRGARFVALRPAATTRPQRVLAELRHRPGHRLRLRQRARHRRPRARHRVAAVAGRRSARSTAC